MTRLQELRQKVSEQRLEQIRAGEALRLAAGWACLGCGGDIDEYSLGCVQCRDRAYKHVRAASFNPIRAEKAQHHLNVRHDDAHERTRNAASVRGRANPWPQGRPEGGQGNELLREAWRC